MPWWRVGLQWCSAPLGSLSTILITRLLIIIVITDQEADSKYFCYALVADQNRPQSLVFAKFLERFRSRALEHTVEVGKPSWVQDGLWSDQSCPLPTLTYRLEPNDRPRYLNVVIKPLCGKIDICLNYHFRLWSSVRVLSITDHDRKMLVWLCISVALLRYLAEKPEHANVPIIYDVAATWIA